LRSSTGPQQTRCHAASSCRGLRVPGQQGALRHSCLSVSRSLVVMSAGRRITQSIHRGNALVTAMSQDGMVQLTKLMSQIQRVCARTTCSCTLYCETKVGMQ
jgi:hypothetical protein